MADQESVDAAQQGLSAVDIIANLAGRPADVAAAFGRNWQQMEQKLRGETDEQYAQRAAERRRNAPLAGTRFAPPGGPDLLDQFGSDAMLRAIPRAPDGSIDYARAVSRLQSFFGGPPEGPGTAY